jgi:hypothetical protein
VNAINEEGTLALVQIPHPRFRSCLADEGCGGALDGRS